MSEYPENDGHRKVEGYIAGLAAQLEPHIDTTMVDGEAYVSLATIWSLLVRENLAPPGILLYDDEEQAKAYDIGRLELMAAYAALIKAALRRHANDVELDVDVGEELKKFFAGGDEDGSDNPESV